MTGMDQLLAKPALIHRILVFDRRRDRHALGDSIAAGEGELLMDMGLDRQALQKEGQQREGRHPLSGRGPSREGISLTRHMPLSKVDGLND